MTRCRVITVGKSAYRGGGKVIEERRIDPSRGDDMFECPDHLFGVGGCSLSADLLEQRGCIDLVPVHAPDSAGTGRRQAEVLSARLTGSPKGLRQGGEKQDADS